MKNHQRRGALLLVALVAAFPLAGHAALKKNQTYYTKANIWFEHPEKVYSTNYHVGQIVPAGSEVEMLDYKRGKARFKVKKSGVVILFTHVPKHSIISADDFFDRYFLETDLSKTLSSFSEMEQKNIKAGTVALGMGKDAVFAAYGNPPSHRTASLDNDRWIYWINRFATTTVVFTDGKVSTVE